MLVNYLVSKESFSNMYFSLLRLFIFIRKRKIIKKHECKEYVFLKKHKSNNSRDFKKRSLVDLIDTGTKNLQEWR